MHDFFSTLSIGIIIQIAGVAGFLILYSRQGGASAAKAVIDLKNEQIKAYEDKLNQLRSDMQQREDTHRSDLKIREDTHRREMHTLHERIGVIEGQIKAKEVELVRLTAIFQNRDPQSTQIAAATNDYMQTTLPLLLAIAKKLDISPA